MLQGLLIEKREEFVPSPPDGLEEIDKNNFIRHFADRDAAEKHWFNPATAYDWSGVSIMEVTPEELNSDKVAEWVTSCKPDIALSYGVHKLDNSLLARFPDYSWNIHGGLSPWYRGAITLFWPLYFLQPNWAGMTIHYLTSKLDAGEIVHHSVPQLSRGDGIHDVACKAVIQAAEDVTRLIDMLRNGEKLPKVPQKSSGKLFLAKDWTPQHLRLIYNTFNNDIVDKYLDGELGHQEPPLIRAFEK
ncbi:formyltransferase family protein [Paenibacillus hamazuiensis]|uniref:formyltransferase family protein n=1 Tax=Paenibacillus hamazuiensis TaxID=2936508 RepID=UPI00200CD758|nr:formyltransferase family protein [Paenibacillus hamazuiensis]